MHGLKLEIYVSFVKEGSGESSHFDHKLKYSLPITNRDNLDVVEKGPTSYVATKHAHVVSSSEDGHPHESIVHIALERVVKSIKTHYLRQGNQSPERSVRSRASFSESH